MSVQLSVRSANTEDDLVALAEWLREERELQGRIRQLRRPIAEGELGGAFEMIAVAIGSGGMGSVLAGSLTTWLQNRPKTSIKITRGDLSIEIDSGKVKDLPLVIEKLIDGTDGATG
ncbi:effector-associated constant component EACC1 [Amycolatopsis sp. cmx-11-12]|uniref:effector-associated constant component EACC1 n=1 Tax=Amycolatopsis sp. cmx-11-12 TaxID=2785795 RepID=UPI00391828C5